MDVIDASALVGWLSGESESAPLDELMRGCALGRTVVAAPELLILEATNAFWKGVQRGQRTVVEALELAADLADLDLELHPHRGLASRALQVALERKLSVYDASYLALAEQERARLWTADQRFGRTVEDLVAVVLVQAA